MTHRPRFQPALDARTRAEPLEPRLLLAVQFVGDYDTDPADSFPSDFTPHNGSLYFFATDAATGRELWRTDGTVSGTTRVLDLNPGPANSAPAHSTPDHPGFGLPTDILSAGDAVYFAATDGRSGVELYRSLGHAASTSLVKDINPNGDADPSDFAQINGQVFFTAATSATQRGVFVTRGSAASTVPLTPAAVDVVLDESAWPVASGGRYYFAARTPEHGTELWVTDGTPAGTRVVKDLAPGPASLSPYWLTDVGGTLYLIGHDNTPGGAGLWKTDGTEDGTVLLARGVGISSPWHRPAAIGSTLYFVAGSGLWKTDGTAAGTVELRPPGLGEFDPFPVSLLTAAGGRLFFRQGPELWTSDGTAEGTVFVTRDYLPPLGSGTISDLSAVGGRFFFRVSSQDSQGVLRGFVWTSDGTAAGTVPLAEVPPVSHRPIPPFGAGVLGGLAYLPGYDPPAGVELWRTDGTPAGTARFADLDPGTRSLTVFDFAAVGDELFFSPHSGASASDLIRTDGTPQGTTIVRDGTGLPPNGINEMGAVGDTVFFASNDFGYPRGLWKTDGTPGGTAFVSGLGTTPWDAVAAYGFRAAGDVLYFGSNGPYTSPWPGPWLWRSDGTAAGTVGVRPYQTVWVGDGQSVGGAFYYAADDGVTGAELWKTDGTPVGTVQVADLAASGGAAPRNLTALGDVLLFTADPSGAGGLPTSLWRTDGTPAGTVRLTPDGVTPAFLDGKPLPVLDAYAYFGATDAAGAPAVWRTDGTPEGTVPVHNLSRDHVLNDMAVAAELVFFATLDRNGHPWLFQTDGTAGGAGFVAGAPTPFKPITFVGEFGGQLLFTFDDFGGRELWRTTGTQGSTRRLADLYPGPEGSHPQQFVSAGDALYFTAVDPEHGREIWKYTPDPRPQPATLVGRHVFYNNSAFDGGRTWAEPADDAAIATDKRALLPGQSPTFDNVTSYAKGINGVMIDLAGVHSGLLLSDFVFKVGAGGDPTGWTPVRPASTVPPLVSRSLAGGASRLTFTWNDGTIRNTWLQVTVKANSRTGLVADEIFSFGNLVGDTGGRGAAGAVASVDALDLFRTRRAASPAASITNPHDHNRDGRVSPADYAIARSNLNRRLLAFTAPASPPTVPVLSRADTSDEEAEGAAAALL